MSYCDANSMVVLLLTYIGIRATVKFPKGLSLAAGLGVWAPITIRTDVTKRKSSGHQQQSSTSPHLKREWYTQRHALLIAIINSRPIYPLNE